MWRACANVFPSLRYRSRRFLYRVSDAFCCSQTMRDDLENRSKRLFQSCIVLLLYENVISPETFVLSRNLVLISFETTAYRGRARHFQSRSSVQHPRDASQKCEAAQNILMQSFTARPKLVSRQNARTSLSIRCKDSSVSIDKHIWLPEPLGDSPNIINPQNRNSRGIQTHLAS